MDSFSYYRNKQFFVREQILSDGSKVYSVYTKGKYATDRAMIDESDSEKGALDLCDRLAAAVG